MKKVIKRLRETILTKIFLEELIGILVVFAIPLFNLSILTYFIENKNVLIIVGIIYAIILFIFSAVIDMFMILKRLGIKNYTFKKRDKWYKEFYYLLKYGVNIFEGQIGRVDGEAAYTRKRYTSLFYDKYLVNKSDGDLWIMVEKKKARVYSKSFIMKNNIPNKLTDKKICETWREPGTDIIYYGTLTIMNIVFYSWYFFIR